MRMTTSICIGAVVGGGLVGISSTPMPAALLAHLGLPVLKASTLVESIGFGAVGALVGMIIALILTKVSQKRNQTSGSSGETA